MGRLGPYDCRALPSGGRAFPLSAWRIGKRTRICFLIGYHRQTKLRASAAAAFASEDAYEGSTILKSRDNALMMRAKKVQGGRAVDIRMVKCQAQSIQCATTANEISNQSLQASHCCYDLRVAQRSTHQTHKALITIRKSFLRDTESYLC